VNNTKLVVGVLFAVVASSPAWAAEDQHSGHAGMEANDMGGMNMDGMSMDMSSEQAVQQVSGQGGSAPADARDPHAYSNGYGFGEDTIKLKLADEKSFASLLANRFESVNDGNNNWLTYDIQAWYGRDYDRLVVKAEGDADNGKLQESITELLWSHSIASFWDGQLGIRYDDGEDPSQSWLAVGVQGLAPYWFEVDVTAYVGDNGRSALAVEAEYELLITQKWILQPRFEAGLNGKDDPVRGQGTGLTDMSLGIRLRYEIRREFAPYVGVEWAGTYGGTADYARAAGQDVSDTRLVAGLRFWF